MTRFKLGRGASSDALALMAIKLVTICLGFVVTRLLSEHLSTYDYGTYSQILLVVSTVSSLTILGMMDGINYFFCSERDEQKSESYIATLFSMQCMVSAAAGAVVLLLRNVLIAGFGNPDVGRLLIFAAALPLLQNLVSMLQILMVSIGKARMIAFRNLIVSLVRLAAVLVVIALVRNVTVVLMATLLLDIGQIAVFHWILRKNRCFVDLRRTDFRLAGRILEYCLPMAVFTMLNTLNRDCDKYLISAMTDTETLAVYTNASKILPFDIVMTSFCTVLIPEITRLISGRERTRAATLYRQFLEIAYLSTTILCCAALAAAPQLMQLLYSEKYLSGLPVFCIYILVDMIRFTNITLILSAAGKTKQLMFLSFGALMANFLLNLILFRLLGVPGPAVATLITTLCVGFLMLWLNARELQVPIAAFFELRYLARFLLENAATLSLMTILRQWMEVQEVHSFLVLVAAAMSYCAVLLLLNGKRLLQDLKAINQISRGE